MTAFDAFTVRTVKCCLFFPSTARLQRLTVYQDTGNNSQVEATQHSPRSPHRDNAAFTAFQPADMGVNPLPLRTQSPEGERIMIHHTTQAHAEPRQPALYPVLPATDNSQPPEEDQRKQATTVQQGIPAEAYGQQPRIDPKRTPYVVMGPPLPLSIGPDPP